MTTTTVFDSHSQTTTVISPPNDPGVTVQTMHLKFAGKIHLSVAIDGGPDATISLTAKDATALAKALLTFATDPTPNK